MRIVKADEELQIVVGEVYIPYIPDTDGDFMSPKDIQKMAHQFLIDGNVRNIDKQHNHNILDCCVVESYIARESDSEFTEGSWIVSIKVFDEEIWKQIKSGELNGFSMEGTAKTRKASVDLIIPETLSGQTFPQDGHSHTYTITYNKEGKFMGGSTDTVSGHSHSIAKGSSTDTASGHTHRYSFTEQLRAANA